MTDSTHEMVMCNVTVQRMESKQFHAICKVLQLFCRVRGYKYIIKFFPHEVTHVEVCMVALQSQDRTDHQNWETRYILLLWMCQLCLIPFDICSLDSTLSSVTTTDDTSRASSKGHGQEDGGEATQSRLVCDIITISKEHLSESGPTREAAYACLSALFTRPDMESTLLRDFMCWCCERLQVWNNKGEDAEHELTRDSFQQIGILHTMSTIFKKGHRNNVLPCADWCCGYLQRMRRVRCECALYILHSAGFQFIRSFLFPVEHVCIPPAIFGDCFPHTLSVFPQRCCEHSVQVHAANT